MQFISLMEFDLHNTEKLEAYLREYRHAANFLDIIIWYYNYLSNNFIREFKTEFVKGFKKIINRDETWHFKYNRTVQFYYELFGRD